ncbi:MAG TPA: peptidoglycan-binding protein [Polyangiaceae bacterium]|nr:peptidoglycan-binding protein [Polyangiaceae bacterium]
MPRVSDQLTPVTTAQVFDALGAAWRNAFAEEPKRASLLVLLSQWALETGRGKSMHCYNLGNIKSRQASGDWCFFACNEILGGKVRWFQPDEPECCFRAYPTLDAGAADYLTTLRERFQKAWPAVLAGDAAAFSHLLRESKYYTADEQQYTKTLQALFHEFDRSLPGNEGPASLPDLFTVLGVQTALKALGFDPGVLDGKDGAHTEAAVEQFQKAHGLVADGVVGRLTRTALAEALRVLSAGGSAAR